MRRGVYPGSFDPPTVAHLAVAEVAVAQGHLDELHLVISEVALGKEGRRGPQAHERVRALEALAAGRPWLRALVTGERLLADIAAGYDVLVVGADKWAQVVDPAWYGGSTDARDRALGRLPEVLVAPRPPTPLPPLQAPVIGHLAIDAGHAAVSSTAVRAGAWSLAAPGIETSLWCRGGGYPAD